MQRNQAMIGQQPLSIHLEIDFGNLQVQLTQHNLEMLLDAVIPMQVFRE